MEQIRQAIERAKDNSTSERSLVARLKAEHIDAIFRRTEDGRVYGATFVDHGSRTVLNGSALGKEYAARIWDEWFKNPPTEAPTQTYEPFPVQSEPETVSAQSVGDGDPSLIEQAVFDGLDVFGTLFDTEHEPYEYIAPEFRLIQYKKRKKKKRRRTL